MAVSAEPIMLFQLRSIRYNAGDFRYNCYMDLSALEPWRGVGLGVPEAFFFISIEQFSMSRGLRPLKLKGGIIQSLFDLYPC